MILDVIVILAILFYGIKGFRDGLMRSIVGLVKTSVAIILSACLARPLALFATKACGLQFGELETWLGAAIIIFLIIQLILYLSRRAIDKLNTNGVVNMTDSWLGLVFGLLKVCLLLFAMFWALYVISKLPIIGDVKGLLLDGSSFTAWLYERSIELLNWLV